MTGPQAFPGGATQPVDDDDDGDDVLDNADGLPDDVPNDALIETEMQVPGGNVADTDVDAPVQGTPPTDADIGA